MVFIYLLQGFQTYNKTQYHMISSEHFEWTREIPLVLNSAGTFNFMYHSTPQVLQIHY